MVRTTGRPDGVCGGQDSEAVSQAPHATPNRGLLVRRDRLLRDLAVHGRSAGISIICAPDGFGKTALLLSYVTEVRTHPERGVAELIDASVMSEGELHEALRRMESELDPARCPLLAVDEIPKLGGAGVEVIAADLRALRERGVEVVVSCRPSNRSLVDALGDSHKVTAQMMLVKPRDYPAWARVFSISSSLDVYELTKGVPSLIALLHSIDSQALGTEAIERAAGELYRLALADMRRSRDALHRIACLMLLTGRGRIGDFERVGIRFRSESLTRLLREYPIFGIGAQRCEYNCLVVKAQALDGLLREIVVRRPQHARKAIEVLIDTGRVDRAVRIIDMLETPAEKLEVVARHPVDFALSGNSGFVNGAVTKLSGEEAQRVSTGVLLAVYMGALLTGEYGVARSMSAELHRRADEISTDINPSVWAEALAFAELWEGCRGTKLPEGVIDVRGYGTPRAKVLKMHGRFWRRLFAGEGASRELIPDTIEDEASLLDRGEGFDVSAILIHCDRLVERALYADAGDVARNDALLQRLQRRLLERRLTPIAEFVRVAAATCRMMVGAPVSDERAFVDAGNAAVRTSDLSMQLFCLLGEGWQDMAGGQLVNARFRAQQVRRLADSNQMMLVAWAHLLERVACIANAPKISLADEAELYDLTQECRVPHEAWGIALTLAGAGQVAELSAWYSMNKPTMLQARFVPMACQAMQAVGERADALRSMLPRRYLTAEMGAKVVMASRHEASRDDPLGLRETVGQLEIGLFGGFRVMRNGHVLTDTVWKRRKACVLASRLALAAGSFVNRRLLAAELWPDADYAHARECLYTSISALRAAFGQQEDGPQYLLSQGEGLAVNTEYVATDVERFDMLARDILLRRAGVSGRQIVESCLRMEELYIGPLFVPDTGDASYHTRMSRLYSSKYVDCMLHGVEVAIEIGDAAAASWLIKAALSEAPYREDVVRAAMHVYDVAGRRREVVELYNSHVHYLEQELHALPEDETRLAYESIIGRAKCSMML